MKCTNMINIKQTKENYLDYGEITVPCGKCLSCLQNRRADWSFRLKEELRNSSTAYFVTLTYQDKYLPYSDYGSTLEKQALQKWLKRLRIQQQRESKSDSTLSMSKKIRYYAVGEYGEERGRPHYHVILFNVISKDIQKTLNRSWQSKDPLTKKTEPTGTVDIGTVTPASIHYVTGYIINRFDDKYKNKQPPFSLMSTKPPIGHQYLERNKDWHKENQYFHVVSDGQKQNLPRFYRDRIFNDSEKIQNQLRLGTLIEKAHFKEHERVTKLGNNYETYKKEQIQDNENRFLNSNKKSKKL